MLAQDPPQQIGLDLGELRAKLLRSAVPAGLGAGGLMVHSAPWWYKVIAASLMVVPGVVVVMVAWARKSSWPILPTVNPLAAISGALALALLTLADLGSPLQIGVSLAALHLYAAGMEWVPGGVPRSVFVRGSIAGLLAGTLMMQGFVLIAAGA